MIQSTALNAIIKHVKQYIPTSYPLKNFIATNPLFDLTHLSLDECLLEVSKYIDINGTLTLEQYHYYYNTGVVTQLHLEQSLAEFLAARGDDSSNGKDNARGTAKHSVQETNNRSSIVKLMQILTDIKIQQKLMLLSATTNNKYPTSFNSEVATMVIKFLAAILDNGQASWAMPVAHNSLYNAWRQYIIMDHLINNQLQDISSVKSDEALVVLIAKLAIPHHYIECYFKQIIFQILGWCSFIKYLEQRDNKVINNTVANNDSSNSILADNRAFATICDVLAIWLSLEYAFISSAKTDNVPVKQSVNNYQDGREFSNGNINQYSGGSDIGSSNDSDSNSSINNGINNGINSGISRKCKLAEFLANLLDEDSSHLAKKLNRYTIGLIWQRALELSYQLKLLNMIRVNIAGHIPEQKISPKAQLIFCIDPRSEGIRRKLETIANYDTYGFAGFFNFDIKLIGSRDNSCLYQCPALIEPQLTLTVDDDMSSSSIIDRVGRAFQSLKMIVSSVKTTTLAPLILFDMIGIFFAPILIAKTLLSARAAKFNNNIQYTDSSINIFNSNESYDNIALRVATLLKFIGLVDNFAKIVLVVGHKAQSDNNPFHATLECGACGANNGIPNAIVFCQAANDKDIRAILASNHNIVIPEETFFISSCHNTTCDEFSYYNTDKLTHSRELNFYSIKADLDHAGKLLSDERKSELHNNYKINSSNISWAELIPETGAINNAAIIIGPRFLSYNLNLNSRVFLQSYDPFLDLDGSILANIFDTSVIISHLINSQYYFSTTDKNLYGAGNKAIHNIVSGCGVMSGNFSDYKIGLPEQSISYQNTLIHLPLRLIIIVYAACNIVEQILTNSVIINNLVKGNWLSLEIIEP